MRSVLSCKELHVFDKVQINDNQQVKMIKEKKQNEIEVKAW